MSIVKSRKSRRKFTQDCVSKENILELVKAGLSAPSSKNLRPFEFIVVTQEELIEKFFDISPQWGILKNTKQFIIVCGNTQADSREAQMLMATSAATQNILLRCEELELGAVWIGCYPDTVRMNFIKELFKLEDHIVPISIVSFGHKEDNEVKQREYDMSKVKFY